MPKTATAPLSPEEAFKQIEEHLADYINGGPDREEEDIELGKDCGFTREQIGRAWSDTREVRAKPKREAIKESPVVDGEEQPKGKGDEKEKAQAFFKKPVAQPGIDREPSSQPDTATLPRPAFDFKAEATGGDVVLNKASPFDSARKFAQRKCFVDGELATYYWQGRFWRWNGAFYEEVDEAKITEEVWRFLNEAKVRGKADGDRAKFLPKSHDVDEVIKALQAGTSLDAQFTPPRWFDGSPGTDLLVFKNCLLNVVTGETTRLNSKLWIHDGAGYDFSWDADAPRWAQFLEETFPDDIESQQALEEQLGYCMTYDTRFEKGMLWIGVRRSGKSTTAHVLRQLVGQRAYVPLSFDTLTRTENSAQGLIGKRVAVFPDTRFKPGKWYGQTYDPGGIGHASAELLLNVIGRDPISVGQKYKNKWVGQLPTKIIITSNEVPNLQDSSGVLPSRFIKLEFKQSFWGKEDVYLREKLEAELPGIATRCLGRYREAYERGCLIQPLAGRELDQRIIARINPLAEFMQDCWAVEPGAEGPTCAGFYGVFELWCQDHHREDLLRSHPKQKLIQEINKIDGWEWLKSVHPHGQLRRYAGIRKKPSEG